MRYKFLFGFAQAYFFRFLVITQWARRMYKGHNANPLLTLRLHQYLFGFLLFYP